jgi:peptidoglycan/LPS O-acetylase OafA/YrhL
MKSVNQTEQSGDHIQLSKRYSQRENSTPDVINATESASVPLNKSSKSLHYPMIDLLRGFAALSVIVYHVIDHINWKNFPLNGPVGHWFRVGWMSVDLFFVISGFVIVLSAVKSYEKSDSIASFQRGYLKRRFTRIVPLHYLSCGLFLLFIVPEMLTLPRLKFHLLTHALFVHNWHPATIGSINGSNWSLGVEMQFYLLVMLAAGWLAKVRPIVLLSSCICISWVWRFSAWQLYDQQIKFGNNLTWMYTSQVFGMLDLFAWGGVLAIILHRDKTGKIQLYLNRWWLSAVAALLIAFPLMKIYWANAEYWTIPGMVKFWRTPEGLFWCLVLAAVCGLGDGRISRLTLPLRYFGTISYGLYLWHIPVILSLKKTSLINHPETFLFYTLFLTCICASVSWHFFEKPILDRCNK